MSRRQLSLPSFLSEYNSLINPILIQFAAYIRLVSDKNHPIRKMRDIGLPHAKPGNKSGTVINPEIIKSYGGKEIQLQDGEMAFCEGNIASHYFQIVQGSIKMFTVSADGKEFIQGMFRTGDSFGEPPLFCDFPYPSSASAIGVCGLLKLPKDKFLTLLRENFEVHLLLNRLLCQRLKYKSMVLSEISSYDPEHRIMSLLKYMKSEFRVDHQNGQARPDGKYVIPFTRQQLADMSGLRVETVIRTVKKMDREGKVKLAGRKITL
jgi:CRP/FNR family cyclic AMP-dependent transcriptional regulator